MTPVSIFIHPGAPSDARIFEGILKELKRRRLIKKGDIIYFDRGYFSHKNYQIAINIYRIIPIIFPKSNYDINKIKDTMSLPLDSYKDMSTFEKTKNEIADLVNQTVELLTNWKDLKPDRGIIEDFFKAAKRSIWFRRIPQLYRKIHGKKYPIRTTINYPRCVSVVLKL